MVQVPMFGCRDLWVVNSVISLFLPFLEVLNLTTDGVPTERNGLRQIDFRFLL